LQDNFAITLLCNRPVAKRDLESWYDLSLSACRLKVVPLPFFDRSGSEVDPRAVPEETDNPFEPVAAESRRFDLLVNVNQLALLRPLSPFSVFLCHFPDVPRDGHFAADQYSCFVVNSCFTGEWVRKRWRIVPTVLLYPPVHVKCPPAEKENIILSVARFEIGGSKKQHELIRAFEELRQAEPELVAGWRLVLVGGSLPDNSYLDEIQAQTRKGAAPVEIRVNVAHEELAGLYARAKIFWHACGLNETSPHLIEHFGMTTVEAMQNNCVPIVFDGGGQREVVEHEKSGYRFARLDDLCRYTLGLIASPDLLVQLQENAYQRSQVFARERFEGYVRHLFEALYSIVARRTRPPTAGPSA
jgi:glycosyltransferase involved in cell wall biosynthesis